MFASKKKTKGKDTSNEKDSNKNVSKNISKQFKSFIRRKKSSKLDDVSQFSSVDSNTDNSLRSSLIEENDLGKSANDTLSIDEEVELDYEENVLVYPNWYKQTLNLPQCKPVYTELKFHLNILRSSNGDFGFVLRKGIFMERFTNTDGYFSETKKLGIFAEPVNMNRENLLLPGDKLLEVNHVDIQQRLREEIIGIIKSCDMDVNLTVQPSPECLEFSFRRFTTFCPNHIDIRSWLKDKKSFCGIYKELYNKVLNNFESLTCVQLVTKDSSIGSPNSEERVWINFNEGFAAGSLIKKNIGGKCHVKLLDNDSEIHVPEEDVHPANSTNYDIEENMLLLPHLNESSLLHNVRQRFSNNLIHTYVGKHMIYVNPMNTLNCFSEKAMYLFKSANPEDLPPHIYSTAQNTFQNLKSTKENQAICILGRSGSGKSVALKHLVNYFACMTSNNKTNISHENVQALWILLDAFTCTRTGINTNASRCGKRISLNFSHNNHNLFLSWLHVQIFLLDKNRIFRRPDREPTYHIFYNFLAGVNDKQKQTYKLSFSNESNTFMTPLHRESEKDLASEQWETICQAAFLLGISEAEWDVICRILSSIIHLGASKSTMFCHNGQTGCKFLHKEASKRAAETLNCSEEALHRAVFEFYEENLEKSDDHTKDHFPLGMSYNSQDLLNGFASGLYSEVVEMVIFFINRFFGSTYNRTINSIVIVDPPGFQVPTSYNKNCVGIYEDLLYNYSYEQLLNLNLTNNITKQMDLYNKENINVEVLDNMEINNPILSLLDGDCKVEVYDTIGKKGVLNCIESEALVGNPETFVKKLSLLYQSHHKSVADKSKRVLKTVNSKTGNFTINHCYMSQTLKYNLNDGLKYSRELPTFSSSEVLLSMCHNDTIQNILTSLSKNQSETSDIKYSNRSVLARNKLEMNDVINCLNKTNHLSFIYCIASIPNAGLCQLKDCIDKNVFDENVTCGGLFSVPLVKIQLQSFQIFQILRIMKFSYPESLTFDNFFYIIKNIVPSSELSDTETMDANAVLKILNFLKIKPKRYKIGNDQLFFRLGTVFELKNSKELASTAFIVKFQSLCRQYLAKKQFAKLKLQTDAIRIIQRNCLMYSKIREWSWWKLYSKIRPLIVVLRVDEELKIVKNQVDELQHKNQELENEKDRFKKEERQLENTIGDLKNEIVIYRQKLQKLSCILEDKEQNQMVLEKRVEELQEEMSEYDINILKLENDLKFFKGEGNNHYETNPKVDSEDSEDFKDSSVEKLIQDSKIQKEEIEIELIKTKKVCDNLKLELEDFKYHMESYVTPDDIEQKQRNYEKEIKRLQRSISEEASYREDLKRDYDKIFSEKLLLENKIKELTNEISSNVRILQTNSSVDYNNMEFGEREYLFKKQKSELEQRIRELEEEVDEANDNHDLSQKEKMKLQLQIDKLYKEKLSEVNEKDEEIEHLKASNSKKVKNLELQLEEDSFKRQSLMKDKREADRLILELRQKIDIQKDLNLEKKLKKELKSTQELLNDALDQIEEMKNRRENKSEIKDLKDKLDNAEYINEMLQKQKSSREREFDEYHQDIENLTNTKCELETKLKQSKADFFNMQSQNEDMESVIADSEKKIKHLQSQIIVLTNSGNDFQEKVESLEIENKKFFTKIEKLEHELNSHNNEQVEKSDMIRLQNKVTELEMKLHFDESLKTRLQSTNERLKAQLYEAQADKESIQNQEAIDHERIKKFERQLKEYRDIEDVQSKEISEMKAKIKLLTDKNIDTDEEMERKNHECMLLKNRVKQLEQMLETCDDENSDHSFSEILNKADNLIKSRKLSLDQGILHKSHGDRTHFNVNEY